MKVSINVDCTPEEARTVSWSARHDVVARRHDGQDAGADDERRGLDKSRTNDENHIPGRDRGPGRHAEEILVRLSRRQSIRRV
jgi:hypothetical protein